MIKGDCDICVHRDKPSFSATCVECGIAGKNYKPITNFDAIHAMNVVELAMFMTDIAKKSAEKLCDSLKTVDVDLSNCDFGILTQAHLDWLKSPVEGTE